MVLRRNVKLVSKHPTAEEDETREHRENRLSSYLNSLYFLTIPHVNQKKAYKQNHS